MARKRKRRAVITMEALDGPIVFDERLRAAADAKQLELQALREFLEALADRLRQEDRRLLAFSSREAGVFKVIVAVDLAGEGGYLDGLPFLKRRRARQFPAETPRLRRLRARRRKSGKWIGTQRGRLIDYAALAGVCRPLDHAHGHSTGHLKHVLDQLAVRGSYGDRTATAKAKWTRLLKHVRFDCEGLQATCREALRADP